MRAQVGRKLSLILCPGAIDQRPQPRLTLASRLLETLASDDLTCAERKASALPARIELLKCA